MNQKEVLEFDGFRVERESFLGGDCYGVVTFFGSSCSCHESYGNCRKKGSFHV